MKQIDKSRAKNFFISFGVFFSVVGIVGLFSGHNKPPNFHGRWGWLWEIIYNNFGPDGENYVFILGGAFCFYYAIFKTKNINKQH
jgi:hypothetical protein